MDMQQQLDDLAQAAFGALHKDEHATVSYSGEVTDFARLNHGRVRQAGTVDQADVSVRILRGRRHASRSLTLRGEGDAARVAAAVGGLRGLLDLVPEDPHLSVHTEPVQQASVLGEAPDGPEAVSAVLDMAAAGGAPPDLVGIWASGRMGRGFASSWGQRSWFERGTWSLDFSLVHAGDKAVKRSVSGLAWDPARVRAAMDTARQELVALGRPVRTIAPGEYRAWLAPAAVEELWSLLRREFGERARQTKTTPLMPAIEGKQKFSPLVTARESVGTGVAPGFSGDGWPRPPAIDLVRAGEVVGSLVSSRSAEEYKVPCNGAGAWESAEALSLEPGTLAEADVLATLGTGLRVSDLWYTNYSDRQACRVTGMTRFATFWVEDGEIIAPIQVMRFDDSAIRIFGDGLLALGAEAALGMSTSTYFQRATGSTQVPGALVDGLKLTL
jgi:predicted Zn-dependent protease